MYRDLACDLGKLRANPGNSQPDSPQALWSDDIERFTVGIAKREIGKSTPAGSGDLAQALAVRRYDPNTPRPCRIKIPLTVNFHAIRAAKAGFSGEIDKKPAIVDRAVRLNVISEDLPLIRQWTSVVDVKSFFAW